MSETTQTGTLVEKAARIMESKMPRRAHPECALEAAQALADAGMLADAEKADADLADAKCTIFYWNVEAQKERDRANEVEHLLRRDRATLARARQAVRDGMHDDTCAVSTGSGDCDCWKDDLMRVLDGRD